MNFPNSIFVVAKQPEQNPLPGINQACVFRSPLYQPQKTHQALIGLAKTHLPATASQPCLRSESENITICTIACKTIITFFSKNFKSFSKPCFTDLNACPPGWTPWREKLFFAKPDQSDEIQAWGGTTFETGAGRTRTDDI